MKSSPGKGIRKFPNQRGHTFIFISILDTQTVMTNVCCWEFLWTMPPSEGQLHCHVVIYAFPGQSVYIYWDMVWWNKKNIDFVRSTAWLCLRVSESHVHTRDYYTTTHCHRDCMNGKGWKMTGPLPRSPCKEQESQMLYIIYWNNCLKIEF